MLKESIRLNASDLGSKWGFEDGEILNKIADEYVRCDEHVVLYILIKKYLIPLFRNPIELKFIQTSHNPCRIHDDHIISDELEDELYSLYVDIPIKKVVKEFENYLGYRCFLDNNYK